HDAGALNSTDNSLAAVNIAFGEEESDFHGGGFSGVGTVHGVGVDAVGKISADGTGIGFLGVGGAHQVAVGLDGVFAFQHLHEHRTRNHEINQILVERTLFVNGIETLGVVARQLLQAGSHNLETGFFKAGNDLANDVLGDGIGCDNGESTFNSHVRSKQKYIGGSKMKRSLKAKTKF